MTTLFEQPTRQRVGPAQAAAWLRNIAGGYRPMSAANVQRLTSEIKGGRWDPDNPTDPIRFDTLGQLRGGRMRLAAVVASGMDVELHVLIPPPPLPHETTPGSYLGPQATVEAVRWDGGSLDPVIDWAEREKLNLVSITLNKARDLAVQVCGVGFPELVLPGDWLVRGPKGYTCVDHHLFAEHHAYRGPA